MPRPPVVVTRARPDDVDDLVVLWAQARDELARTVRNLSGTSVEHMRSRLSDALSGGSVHVLLAHHDGVPAGYALVTIGAVNPLLDGLVLQVEHMYVAQDLRHRGVAKAILAKVTAVAEKHGCEQVLSNVAPAARESHRFLARLGFTPLLVKRVVPTATLRRRLAGQGRRGGLEDLLSRRRSQRARSSRTAWEGFLPGRTGTDDAFVLEGDEACVIDLTRGDPRLDGTGDTGPRPRSRTAPA